MTLLPAYSITKGSEELFLFLTLQTRYLSRFYQAASYPYKNDSQGNT